MPSYTQGGVTYDCPECNNANEAVSKARQAELAQAKALEDTLNSIKNTSEYLNQVDAFNLRLDIIKQYEEMSQYVVKEQALELEYQKELKNRVVELEEVKAEAMLEQIVDETIQQEKEISDIINQSYIDKLIIKNEEPEPVALNEYNEEKAYSITNTPKPQNIIGLALIAVGGLIVVTGVLK
jgi:glycyl-tRNA synthetase beta subunit